MYVTKEQKKFASQVDLVDYLNSIGYEMVKSGQSYKVKVSKNGILSDCGSDMSSLSIYPNRKSWKRWSTGESGGDAIAFLQKNMGMSFQEAVLELVGDQVLNTASSFKVTPVVRPHIIPPEEEPKFFTLPAQYEEGKSKYFPQLYAYLTQTRCIDANIVKVLVNQGRIYQDVRKNAMFVGVDEQNQARFACLRGTNTFQPYKTDWNGSDKRYAFSIEGTNQKKVYVFESPIDLLSHASMTNIRIRHPKAWTVHSRVSLAGISDVALEQFLHTHPQTEKIYFYLDNDETGRVNAEKYCKKYAAMGYQVFNFCPKNKDVNEDLVAYVRTFVSMQQSQNQTGLKRK